MESTESPPVLPEGQTAELVQLYK